jgi:hypothetical protein
MRYGSEPTPYARPGSRAPLCALRDVGKRVVAKPSLRGATSAAGWRRVTQHARVVASAAPYGDGDVSGGAAVTIVASQMARPGGEAGGDNLDVECHRSCAEVVPNCEVVAVIRLVRALPAANRLDCHVEMDILVRAEACVDVRREIGEAHTKAPSSPPVASKID